MVLFSGCHDWTRNRLLSFFLFSFFLSSFLSSCRRWSDNRAFLFRCLQFVLRGKRITLLQCTAWLQFARSLYISHHNFLSLSFPHTLSLSLSGSHFHPTLSPNFFGGKKVVVVAEVSAPVSAQATLVEKESEASESERE